MALSDAGRTVPASWTSAAHLLRWLAGTDGGRPRLTWYDDVRGERVELSAAVLLNWVAKASSLLVDDADAQPGVRVTLDLPGHWRTCYWALATWWLGGCVVVPAARLDPPTTSPGQVSAPVLVTDDADRAASHDGYAVLVTLPMLARRHPQLPPGVVDEAAELAAYPDTPPDPDHPTPEHPALVVPGRDPLTESVTTYRELLTPAGGAQRPRARITARLPLVLTQAMAAWAAGGSVVVVDPGRDDETTRLAGEGITADFTE